MIAYFFGTATVLLVAMLIEDRLGYPDTLYRRIGHPVTWIGAMIAACDRQLNQPRFSFGARRALGVVALILFAGAAVAFAVSFDRLLHAILPAWAAHGLLGLAAASLIARKSLRDHVIAVAEGLEQDLPAGRRAVSMIVGRDPEQLDEAGVARAAVESLAENTSDGIVAPAMWCLLLGLPGLVLYKAVNTADSMIGHKSEKHFAFGWASARLDDFLNLPFSRFTALLFAASARLEQPPSAARCWRTALRDAPGHQSPNAGWPEAALAGALGFGLGGPRSYGAEVIDLPMMGDGRRNLNASDIRRALGLQERAMNMLLAALLALFLGLAAI